MKRLRQYVETAGFRLLLAAARLAPRRPWLALGALRATLWLPFRWQCRLGAWLGSLMYHLHGRRRQITATNIGLCFPELDPPARLVVWAFRRWILGLRQNSGLHWSLVWNEFAGRLGTHDGRVAMSGFTEMMQHFQRHARRAWLRENTR